EKLHNELKGLWLILEYLPHIYYDKDLGEYHGHVTHQASDDSAEVRRIPRGAYRQIPDGALIHGSVVVRQQTAAENLYPRSKYDPPNLRKGKLEVTGTADLAGIPYYVFREPLESREAIRKKPNPLKLFFQSGIVMLPLATVELIVLLSIILVPVGVIGFLILHFLLAGVWCILRRGSRVKLLGLWNTVSRWEARSRNLASPTIGFCDILAHGYKSGSFREQRSFSQSRVIFASTYQTAARRCVHAARPRREAKAHSNYGLHRVRRSRRV